MLLRGSAKFCFAFEDGKIDDLWFITHVSPPTLGLFTLILREAKFGNISEFVLIWISQQIVKHNSEGAVEGVTWIYNHQLLCSVQQTTWTLRHLYVINNKHISILPGQHLKLVVMEYNTSPIDWCEENYMHSPYVAGNPSDQSPSPSAPPSD